MSSSRHSWRGTTALRLPRRRSLVGIRLATEAVALQSGIVAQPGSKIAGLFSIAAYERWKKNQHCLLPARCRWCGVIYVLAYSPGCAGGYGGVRLCRVVDCGGGDLSLRSPTVAGHAGMVVTLSEVGAPLALGTVLDALDRRICQHSGAIRQRGW